MKEDKEGRNQEVYRVAAEWQRNGEGRLKRKRERERERELKHFGEGKRIGEKRKKEKSKLQNDVFTMKRVD